MNSVGCVPVVTVTCLRDLALLELQAQSIHLYLDAANPVYLIVNESPADEWFDYFNQHIKHYYSNHQLTVLTRDDFNAPWDLWFDYPEKCHWLPGWETQQLLKLFLATQIKNEQYLVLDTKNFLIKSWNPADLIKNNLPPIRGGINVMPEEIWKDYSISLSVSIGPDYYDKITSATPFYFNTNLVKSLINSKRGSFKFAEWFKFASNTKSEFILYGIWAIQQGGLYQFHYNASKEWAELYLRDGIDNFVSLVGTNPWASIHHETWYNMNPELFQLMTDCLQKYELIPRKDLLTVV